MDQLVVAKATRSLKTSCINPNAGAKRKKEMFVMSFLPSSTVPLLVAIATLTSLLLPTLASVPVEKCGAEFGQCHDPPAAMRLKVIAIFAILVAGVVGICLPLISRSIPALNPEGKIFVIMKAFSGGVILATGFLHVLPDAFEALSSACLPETPWRKFPFTTFVAMVAAVLTLIVDSFATSLHERVKGSVVAADVEAVKKKEEKDDGKLMRNRIVAQVLELGIVVHSVVIGLSLGSSQNPCTMRTLVAALCFHQFFEGMGLGGCILQAEYKTRTKAIMVLFFSITNPSGIALGIGLSNVYRDDSPTALIVEGLLNAASAGLLNYMALVDLLAADFMGPKLQSDLMLQLQACVLVFLGVGGMSVLAKWS